MSQRPVPVAVAFALLFAVLSGCEALPNSDSVTGTLNIRLAAAASIPFDEALITIERVELIGYDASGESTLFVLTDQVQQFDVAAIDDDRGVPLAQATVPAGAYHRLRVVTGGALDVRSDETTRRAHPLQQSSFEIPLTGVVISEPGDVVTASLLLHPNTRALPESGADEFLLEPDFELMSVSINGAADNGS